MENAAAAGTAGSHGGRGQTAEEIARATQDMLRRHSEEQRAWNQYHEQKLSLLENLHDNLMRDQRLYFVSGMFIILAAASLAGF